MWLIAFLHSNSLQVVLDLTYYEENQVVQSDFNEANAEQSLAQFMSNYTFLFICLKFGLFL